MAWTESAFFQLNFFEMNWSELPALAIVCACFDTTATKRNDLKSDLGAREKKSFQNKVESARKPVL